MRCGGGHSTVPAVQRASVRWREAEGGGGRRREAEEEGERGHRSRSAQLERRWLVVRVTVDLVDGSHVVGDLAGLEHAGHRLRHPVVQRVSPKEQELRLCLRSTYNAYTMPKRSPKPVSRIARVSVDEWAHNCAGRGRGGAGGGGQRTAHSAQRRQRCGAWPGTGGWRNRHQVPEACPPPPLLRQDRGITYGLADVLAGQVHLLRQPLQQRRLVAMVTRIQDSTVYHTARHTTRECQRR